MLKRIAIATVLIGAAVGSADAQSDLEKAGANVFKKCAACHAVGEGAKNRVGPELNDVVGRTAGTAPDYKYSNAMKEAGEKGLVWGDETLHKYLENPKAFIPGNKMTFPGLKKEDERDAVVAYLRSFSKGG